MTQTTFTHNRLRLLYYKYRDTLVYSFFVLALVLLLCGAIVWQAVFPQVTNWFSIQAEVAATQERIATMRNNITVLQGINDAQLDLDMQSALAALPPGKDFIGTLNSISLSAAKANVTLDDYTFNIGELVNTKDANSTPSGGGAAVISRQNPDQTIRLTLIVSGTVDAVRRFTKELHEKVPVVELNTIQLAGGTATLMLYVHAKPLPPLTFQDSNPIRVLSAQQLTLLSQLRSWQADMSSIGNAIAPSGSGSAELDFSSPFSNITL